MSENQSTKQMRLFDFIKYHAKETIPQELLYPGYRTDKNNYGQTPLMYWIESRHGGAIPDCLYYTGC